jgi:amino acid transporter
MLKGSPARPVLFFFIFLNALIVVFSRKLTAIGFNIDILIIGNIIVFLMTITSLLILRRGLRASSTPGFLRAVYGSFMIKFVLVLVTVFTYGYVNKGNLNKPSLFTMMFLYLIYTFIEIRAVLKLSKHGKNA